MDAAVVASKMFMLLMLMLMFVGEMLNRYCYSFYHCSLFAHRYKAHIAT